MILLLSIAILSAIFHNLVEIKTLKEQLDAAGKTFSFQEHIKRNWIAWLASSLPISILALAHVHLQAQLPTSFWATIVTIIVYAVTGWGGSDFAITVFSTSQKQLTKVIDQKAQTLN